MNHSRDFSTQRCPRCLRTFRTLADETLMHACPHCGYFPEDERHQRREEIGDE